MTLTVLGLACAEADTLQVKNVGSCNLFWRREGPVTPLLSIDGTAEELDEPLRDAPRRHPRHLLPNDARDERSERVVLVSIASVGPQEGLARHALRELGEARVCGGEMRERRGQVNSRRWCVLRQGRDRAILLSRLRLLWG